MNKKALFWRFTIIFVLLLITAGMVFLLMSQLFLKENIDKEACHTSVILRSSASLGPLEARENIHFQCKTEEICLISGGFGGSCDSLGKDYQKEKVKSKEEVLDFIADEIYEWHLILGEGKVNPVEVKTFDKTYCFLDSIISFDVNTINTIENDGKIRYLDIYNYLNSKQTDSEISYLSEIYGIHSSEDILNAYDKVGLDVRDELDLSKDYVILTQFAQEGRLKSIIGGSFVAAGLAAVTVFTGGTGTVAILAATGLGAGAGTVTFWKSAPNTDLPDYGPPVLVEYRDDLLKILDCSRFETIS